MDEPTSVLTPQAVRKLFETLRQLAAEGCSILYISHKLDEIQELCHTATVLRARQGHRHVHAVAGDAEVDGADDDRQGSAGAAARRGRGGRRSRGSGWPACRMRPTIRSAPTSRTSISNVHSGEIVGIAGVSGNGQQELLYAVSGEEPLAEKFPVQILGMRRRADAPGAAGEARHGLRAGGAARSRRGAADVARRERAPDRAPARHA